MRALVSGRVAWLALLAVLVACTSPEPVSTPTQVTVRITSSDSALRAAITQLHVRASYRQAENSWRKPVSNSFAASGLSWPVDVPVFPRDPSEASGQFEVVVQAVQNDLILAEARAITNFQRGKHVQLELRLFACPGREPGFVCTPGCEGTNCSVCNEMGGCDPVVPIDSSRLPQLAAPGETMEAGTGAVFTEEGGTATNPSLSLPDASSPSPTQMSGDAQVPVVTTPDTGVGVSPAVDAGPLAECDAARPCSAGYNCTEGSCVSACIQTQCDANATCSLVAGAPTCTCNRGYIATSGTGTSVVCAQDRQCAELGCDANASCELGTDRLRHCVCKTGYNGNGTSCTPVSCGMPALTNGTVSTSNGVVLNSVATYRCNTGFTQGSGSWTRTCGTDMQWSGTQPTCNEVTCLALTNPTNGWVSTPSGRELGDIATYSCNSGYKLQGSAMRTCQQSGWSGSAPTCAQACGDGTVDTALGEECDNAGSNVWTCTAGCRRRSAYAACPATACAAGDVCFVGMCTRDCNASSASCAPVPAGSGSTQALCLTERNATAYDICAAVGCRSRSDCSPGLGCYTASDGSISYCAACQSVTTGTCN